MKNYKKLYLIVLGIFISAILFLSIQIYAKYVTSAAGNTAISIARWNILVNNASIKNSSDISKAIVPVFEGSDNIASNIIAPTAQGYFDLNLDFTSADVSFKYEIKALVDANSSVKDLIAISYSIDDGDIIQFEKGKTPTISDTILLSDNIKGRKIRIYVMWDDSESSSMSNEQDTLAATSNNPALFNVTLAFTQVAN